jgi:hypothetical protein
MAFTVAQLTALEQAIGNGTLEVTYNGQTVKYRSMDDLRKAYDFVFTKLVDQGLVADNRTRVSVTSYSKD